MVPHPCASALSLQARLTASAPSCPGVLAEFGYNPRPVKMVANKHQLCSCVMLMIMPMFVSVGRPLRRGGRWPMLVRRCILIHGIGHPGPDTLYQQMSGCAFDMSKTLHAQHWLLLGNPIQGFSKSARVLVIITPQDKREPPRIFHVQMLMRHHAVLMRAESGMLVTVHMELPISSGRHTCHMYMGAKFVEV
jgi:hypothetical protein